MTINQTELKKDADFYQVKLLFSDYTNWVLIKKGLPLTHYLSIDL